MANRAKKTRRKVRLEPMNPYERRIIHTTLQKVEGVTTYSEGEEPYRKIVISPDEGAKKD
jgi:spoIIIJ-associated protein